MGMVKEAAGTLREGYEKAQRLLAGAAQDPPERPHASREAARRQLEALRPSAPAQRAALLLQLGAIALDCEQLTDGEAQLGESLRVLQDKELQPECVLIAMAALNHLGLLWSQRGDADQAKTHLDRAETIYKEFTLKGETPIDIDDLFIPSDDKPGADSKINLEKTHTLTLYYLAQIYGTLEDFLKSAVYCHTTLKRQLEFNDYDPIDWALNSATLSQFFMEKNGFKQARHHLSAATYVLDRYEEKLNAEESGNEIHDAKLENFKHRSADVARCWAKYGLILLSNSKDRLLHHADDDDDDDSMSCSLSSDLAKLQLAENSTVSANDLSHLNFPMLDLSIYENEITYKFILTFEDAKFVFQATKSWIDKATSYYTMETLASDHIEIMQDASQLYKNLAFFEDNEERQAKMHKRRIDILEKTIIDLNPTYYLAYLRQIWYELAETYGEILNIKLDKIKLSTERPTPHALNKINTTAEQGVKYYSNFLNSLKQPMTDTMPDKFTPETEKAALLAYFQIARLYVKMIVFDKNCQLQNTEETLDNYSKLINYCDIHTEAGEFLKSELAICRDMVKLLPYKIQKLKRELNIPEEITAE